MPTTEEILATVAQEDQEALVAALRAWEAEGVEHPQIPLEYDVNGDGTLDAWALTSEGTLTLVQSRLNATVYESDGTGIEVGYE